MYTYEKSYVLLGRYFKGIHSGQHVDSKKYSFVLG